MANKDHLEILERGVEKWNRWREENPQVQPDLRRAELDSAYLKGANFGGANLIRACFYDARLEGASFDGACLTRANLNRASLYSSRFVGARLDSASFVDALLDSACLDRAQLDSASLYRASLDCASLVGARLVSARLDGVCLNNARLEGCSLVGARLDGARLNGARLEDARLNSASLEYASLVGARLDRASLYKAHLNRANLDSSCLNGANLTLARFEGTNLCNMDLRKVQTLESVDHYGPSTVGIDTLERSRGQIPTEFLKGCGLSDWEIENSKLWNPDLNADERATIWYEIERIAGEQPINPFRVFISYTRTDEPFVEVLEAYLDTKGVRYWRDVHHLKAGRLQRQIDRAITLNPLVLLVLSERSVESDWVEYEAAKARDLEKEIRKDVLCPIALDDAWKSCAWPGPLRRQIEDYNILDFSGWEDQWTFARQFAKLYEGVIVNYGGLELYGFP